MNINIILESNFKPDELLRLKTLCLQYPSTRVLTLFLHGDIHVLYTRYEQRQATRHPVHTSIGLLSLDSFAEAEKAYSIKDCFGDVTSVDTTSFSERDYHTLLQRVRGWICESDESEVSVSSLKL